ncbi:MAG: hypothetical protein K6U80_06725 [Firmicutes bacterium]|nr:hypothetical protein [Bacillota bacterium]
MDILEPLKNLNALITQVIDFAGKDPSIGKMLEFANFAARQRRPPRQEAESISAGAVEAGEGPPDGGVEAIPPLDKLQILNSTVNSLGDLLEAINQLARQLSKLGPLFAAMIKYQPPTLSYRKLRRHEKPGRPEIKGLDEKTATNALIAMLAPILILSLTKRQGMADSG